MNVVAGNARPTLVRWRILGLLGALSFVSYLLRGNLSIAAPSMIADLRLTEIQWGWVMSAFPLGYALFQFPGGVWGGRIGPRKALALIAVAWGVLIALASAIPSPAVASTAPILACLMAVQFLVGVSHAPVFPMVAVSIERWFPVGRWALPNGLTSSALTIGLALTASLLPWLMAAHGWRRSFLLLAPAGLAVAAWWWWYARDRPAQHRAVDAAEIALISAGRDAGDLDDATRPPPGTRPAWRRVLGDRDVLLVTLSYACMNFVFYVIFSWGFYYLVKVRGFSEQDAGFLTSAQWLAAGIGAALGGWACDRLCQRLGLRWGCRWPIVVGLLASAALMLGVALHPDARIAAAMLGLCFFFNQCTEGPYWATATSIGGRHAGATTGLLNTGANLMGFVNALLLAVVAGAFGWTVAIALGAAFALAGTVLILLVRADRQMAQSD
ncbi:MFS transporter [Luteimonas saliphila]|uniref:MFS transporter n=1 Tax=Luteimonas saliphila TaxID=2804919 RepID=UPI00192D733E|nr:MFS transporter [Luteimonas saliphila]